jgi:hypothetical protein
MIIVCIPKDNILSHDIIYSNMLRHTHRTLFLFMGLIIFVPFFGEAGQMLRMSDAILTSEPGVSSSHTIEFTSPSEIPASGIIKYKFEGRGAPFIFPSIFDYSNMDFAVDKGSGYEFYPLDSFSDTSTSSASLFPNADGEINIRLASDDQYIISAGSKVRLRIGGNAGSSESINNPNIVGSHLISLSSYDSSELPIDVGYAMIATVMPISVTTQVIPLEVILSNGLPKGLLPGGTKKVFISVESHVPAFCRYSLVPNIIYEDIPSAQSLKSENFNRLHSFIMSVEDDHVYNLYLRCYSKFGRVTNKNDYVINFEVGIVPSEKRPPPPPPGTQAGNNTGGGNMLGQSALTIEGKTFPSASVVILKDGKEFRTIIADQQGNFQTDVSEMDRGTYSFMITAVNDKIRSASYNTVLYVTSPTKNSIGPVYMSPTVTSKTSRIDIGGQVIISGKAVPLHTVQAIVVGPKDPLQQPYVINTVTANGAGDYVMTLDTSKLPKGTYSIKSQTLVPNKGNSQFSPEFLVGIGEKPEGDNKRRADINGDGKINIADLSIMLFSWKKSSQTADINMDGTVNITDFSIMLSAWTG